MTEHGSNRTPSSGYVGLLALLLTCLLIAFVFWRADLLTGSGTVGAPSPIEQDIGAIKSAQNAKQQLEDQYTQQIQGAEN